MQIAVAWATQLCRPNVGTIGQLQCTHLFFFLLSSDCVGRKFENNLQTAIKESLALFLVDELKAEQRLIIEKIVARRDVFSRAIAKRTKSKNRMQITQFPARLSQHELVLGEIQGM